MDASEIRITAEPIDGSRCKFMVSQPLHAAGMRRFASPAEAQDSPLAAAIFAIQDAVVMLRMMGGCQGCGMADVTLRQGIEAMLQQHVPAVKGIVDITDHTAGTNPYFAAAKK